MFQEPMDRSAEHLAGEGGTEPCIPILIAGCALSGLDISAAAMNDLGVPCGIDSVYTTDLTSAVASLPAGVCEASSLAIPHVPYLDRTTVLVHQVRHPLDNIADLIEWGVFAVDPRRAGRSRRLRMILDHLVRRAAPSKPDPKVEYVRYVDFHRPEVVISDPVRAALRYWVLWNLELEFYSSTFVRAFTVRAEDPMGLVLPDVVLASGRGPTRLGGGVVAGRSAPISVRTELALEDLPSSWELDVAIDLAVRLGYSL